MFIVADLVSLKLMYKKIFTIYTKFFVHMDLWYYLSVLSPYLWCNKEMVKHPNYQHVWLVFVLLLKTQTSTNQLISGWTAALEKWSMQVAFAFVISFISPRKLFAQLTSFWNYIAVVKKMPSGYKTFFMLNSAEHEIHPAHKC